MFPHAFRCVNISLKKIKGLKFPCSVVTRDIEKPNHIVVKTKGSKAYHGFLIAPRLSGRSVFCASKSRTREFIVSRQSKSYLRLGTFDRCSQLDTIVAQI